MRHKPGKKEFYIGYLEKAPPKTARFMRQVIILILLGVMLAAISITVRQESIGAALFEWGKYRNFQGIFKSTPHPHLLVKRPGNIGVKEPYSYYSLVAPFKWGLSQEILGIFDGQYVSLEGSLLYRKDQTMIEVIPESIKSLGTSERSPTFINNEVDVITMGEFTLTGEIVDSKCYFGMMNPGISKVHRACAVRCISGGIPPVLHVLNSNNNSLYFFLVGEKGETINKKILENVAVTVEVVGNVVRQGDMLVLQTDPNTIKKLN